MKNYIKISGGWDSQPSMFQNLPGWSECIAIVDNICNVGINIPLITYGFTVFRSNYKIPRTENLDGSVYSQRISLVDWRKVHKVSGLPSGHQGVPNSEPSNSASSGWKWIVIASGYRYPRTNSPHQVWSSRWAEVEWFTDGNTFVEIRTQQAWYAIVSLYGVKEAKALPSQISVEKAELIALMRAL